MKALADVKQYGNLPIPLKLRNAPTKLMKDLNYGKDYQMYNDQDLLPEELKGKKYFTVKNLFKMLKNGKNRRWIERLWIFEQRAGGCIGNNVSGWHSPILRPCTLFITMAHCIFPLNQLVVRPKI